MFLSEGLHYNISHDKYHADPCERPSLSSHVAAEMVKHSPGHAALVHPRLGGAQKKRTDAMDTGALLHDFLLGGGADFVEVEHDDWRTKAAREKRDEAESEGKIAVLSGKLATLRKAAEETRKVLPFDVAQARNEVTAIWESDGCPCRCRIDNLFDDLWIWDLKFTEDAIDAAADRNIHNHAIQAASNIDAIETLVEGAAGRVHFGLCFVEWKRPHIGIIRREIRGQLLDIGQRRWARAKRAWAECLSANQWPGYPTDIVEAGCPTWVANEDMEQQINAAGKEPF